MKITRVIALAVIAGSAGVATLNAQNLRNAGEPAEFPPASYKSTQYVDSRGCVFVRAGISGNVTWVPRVNRARKQLCGQSPSLAGAARTATVAAPAAKPPVQITLDSAPAVQKPAVKKPVTPKPVAQKVAKPAVRKPVVVRKPTPVRRQAAAPVKITPTAPVRQVKRPAIKVVPAKTPKVASVAQPVVRTPTVRRQTACAGASSVSQRYLNGGNVRCGPQAQSPYSANTQSARVATPQVLLSVPAQNTYAQNTYRAPQSGRISGATRVVPKHVLVNRQNTQNLPVPQGYRRVWEDDRLNPNRAEQSLAGQAAVKFIWTSTVPRRLIEVGTGRDVTSKVPLIYPYVDLSTQTRDLGAVTIVRQNGQVLKRIRRNAYSGNARQPTLSSRSAPKAVAPKAPVRAKATGGSGLIQVGTYGDQAGAQTVAKRIQRMGLPVRIGKFTRGSQTFRMVLVGPFNGNATQQLSALRSAGFRNAKFR